MLNKKRTKKLGLPAIDILLNTQGVWALDEDARKDMTVSCRDTDYIHKVKNAGKIKEYMGREVQVMHNGLLVTRGGYHGKWMEEIISSLEGHHEPQEEKVFYEVLKRIPSGGSMMELGSFWSYYSIWFNRTIKNSQNVCCEPDPHNLELGKINAELNGSKRIQFFHGAAGKLHKSKNEFIPESDSSKTITVDILSVDGLMKDLGWKKLDLLHLDIQGSELEALEGAIKTIKSKSLRFLFVSTHHYFFSKDPNTHGKCMEFIKQHGGYIVSSHTVAESYSGDGLIVASFDESDKDFKVTTSLNHTDQSLFRPYEEDLTILIRAYDERK